MTGGTELAHKINHNLAKACREFGLGMGLGSCRILLEDDTYFKDFDLRPVMGGDCPFFANLGIAQIEEELANKSLRRVEELIKRLDADGLIIHVNPLQEWLQPEGDKINFPPVDTIRKVLDRVKFKVIVKEVGQGMGFESLKALFQMPLAAIDFAAHGGTNFSKVELLRSNKQQQDLFKDVANIGHSAAEMVTFTNDVLKELGKKALCKEVIISGGVKSFLDGYYLMNTIRCKSIYGQGSAMLERAKESYGQLAEYLESQVKGLELAKSYLRVRK
jgi:isopentenyl-diphosphate delta-isomerase